MLLEGGLGAVVVASEGAVAGGTVAVGEAVDAEGGAVDVIQWQRFRRHHMEVWQIEME